MKGLLNLTRRLTPAALAFGVVLGVAPPAAGAQQPTAPNAGRPVYVKADSVTVVLQGLDSLMRTLMQSRALEERIGMALREYGTSQANAARHQALEAQLQAITENNLQLLSKIQIACTNRKPMDRAPEGYLGVTFNITGTMRREGNGPDIYRFDEPPEIISVESGSPADRAGMRRGDRLLALGGQDVVGRDVVLAQLLVPGRKLAVRVAREGSEPTFVVQVQKRPDGFGDECTDLDLTLSPMQTPLARPSKMGRTFTIIRPTVPPRASAPSTTAPAVPDAPSAPAVWTFDAPPPVAIVSGFSSIVAGAQLTTLTDDFKELTGADAGVMVQRVLPETPAAAAGLKGGDVIVEASGRPVMNARILQRMIGDTDDHALKMKVIRKGKARTVWLRW